MTSIEMIERPLTTLMTTSCWLDRFLLLIQLSAFVSVDLALYTVRVRALQTGLVWLTSELANLGQNLLVLWSHVCQSLRVSYE